MEARKMNTRAPQIMEMNTRAPQIMEGERPVSRRDA